MTSPIRTMRIAGRAGARREMTFGDAQAREQLADAERLGQVIVGAEIERRDLVGLLVARGQHDDRPREPFAQALDHFEPGDVGQAEIDDDDVGLSRRRGLHAFVAGRCGRQRIAVRVERRREKTLDLRIVLDQQQMRARVRHCATGSRAGNGSVKRNSAPPPDAFCAVIVPPCASTIALRDREAEAESALRAFGPGLMELLEDARLLAGRKSGPVIAHGDFERVIVGARGNLERRAGRRVPRDVLDQVRQHLFEHHFVARNERRLRRQVQRDADAMQAAP